MKTYFVVSKKSISQLASEVNKYLKSGAECLGSPFQDNETNFNQAMITEVLIDKNENQNIKTVKPDGTCEYFVMIKFRLRKDSANEFFSEVETYLRKFPYTGLKFCEIYDMENEIGEYAFVEFFDTTEHYLKALDRRDNPILDKLRKFVIPYDDGEEFEGSHGKLTKSFNHLLI